MNCSENITRRLFEARKAERIKEGYESMENEDLIKKAQSGDQYAFEQLLDNYEDFMYRMTKKWVLDTGDSDDVRQEANIGFWQAVQDWDGTGDFDAFAGMIIKRKLTDRLRKDSTEKVQLNTNALSFDQKVKTSQGHGMEYDRYDITPNKKSPSSEDSYFEKETTQKIAHFMKDNLTEVERQVMLLYTQGYKMAEIATKLDMKYKSAENSLMRAKNKLRDFMKSSGIRESASLRASNEFSRREKRMLESILLKIQEEESKR